MRAAVTIGVVVMLAAALGSVRVPAQSESWPFKVGDKISIRPQSGGAYDCDVIDQRGTFVLCDQRQKSGEWLNVAVAVAIQVKRP